MNLPAALVKDPLLSVEDFVEEGRLNPTPSKSDVLAKPTSPASATTQATPGSKRSTLIILNDGK